MNTWAKLGRWSCVPGIRLVALGACVLLLALTSPARGTPSDWQEHVRECVAAKDLPAALQIVDVRLAEAPQDLEARGWRARLLAWSGRWQEAESEYRRVLDVAPHDVDILVGLSYVLSWQGRYDEALAALNRANEIDPARADVHIGRGRALRATGQTVQAHLAFQEALELEPTNQDAKDGLASLVSDPRFTLSFGTDIDSFNYTSTAYAFTTGLTARVNSRWVVNVSGTGQSRFGADAGRFLSSVGYRLTRRDSLTVGGGFANRQAVVPTSEAFFEYGHGFSRGDDKFLQGIETAYNQHWYWYEGARVMTLTPRISFDLPKDWSWSFQITSAQSNFTGLTPGWNTSGLTRLSFPLHKALHGNIFYAVGTEDFALSDQIGRFAARTYGGGLSYWWRQRQQFSGYVALQDRSQQRSQTSYGVSYAVRF